MVDFSLTDGDIHLIELTRREYEVARPFARDVDRYSESEQFLQNVDHPAVVDRKSPNALLRETKSGISGQYITECLMEAAGARDLYTRRMYNSMGTQMLREYGTPEQKAAYGHLSLVIAITEPGAGADPSSMRTNAKYDSATGEYILNGEKTFISGINREDGAVVLLKGEPDENGIRPFYNFIVLKDAPGFQVLPQMQKLGIHYHDLGSFSMQDVRVPSFNKLDGDFRTIQTIFNHYRPYVAAQGLGLCRTLLDFTHAKLAGAGGDVDYAKGRAARSAAEDKLIRMEALWEATWGIIMHVKWTEEQMGERSPELRTGAAMAKVMGGKATREITQGCIELLGPEGLSEDHLAEKWFRDGRITDIYEGPGEVHRLAVARNLLGYRKGELD